MSNNVPLNEENQVKENKNTCTLMYKDVKVLSFNLNKLNNASVINEIYNLKYVPFSLLSENATEEGVLEKANDLNIWLYNRNILSSRAHADELFDVSKMYDFLALNLSDHYWVQRVTDMRELKYKDINYFENEFPTELGDFLMRSQKYDKEDLNSPVLNTNGALPKKWIIEKGVRVLCKGILTGHEPVNEIIANIVCHYSNIRYTPYILAHDSTLAEDDNQGLYCKCNSFLNIDTEYVPSTHLRYYFKDESAGIEGYENIVKYYTKLLKKDAESIRKELEDMLFLDYLIGNTDRHFHNFGLIRDANTLEFIDIAPIFDNGTALFHNHYYNLRDSYSESYEALSEDDFTEICDQYNKTTYQDAKPFFQYHISQVQLIRNRERYKTTNIGAILSSVKAVLSQYKSNEEMNYILKTIEYRFIKLFPS
ncbi:MAG: HipA domain-containing protein [Bacillota bacterium]